MVTETPLFQLLYLSHLAPDQGLGVIKEIATTARTRNPSLGITGAILFDGERFCQLLEGGESDVRALMLRIDSDPRHTAIRTLFEGDTGLQRVMARWTSGYCEAAALEPFESLSGLGGISLIDAFLAVLAGADME